MKTIDFNALVNAHERWCEHHKIAPDRTGPIFIPSFKQFAGIQGRGGVTWSDNQGLTVTVSDKTAHRVTMLNGPYWKALLKAHLLLKGRN